jgi:hypothetical protein
LGRLPRGVPEWFKERYDELKAAGTPSSRYQDIAACRDKYGFAVPDHLIRSLRKVLKPTEWPDKGGRPPTKK